MLTFLFILAKIADFKEKIKHSKHLRLGKLKDRDTWDYIMFWMALWDQRRNPRTGLRQSPIEILAHYTPLWGVDFEKLKIQLFYSLK